ncbi:MAG: hypothetical protein JRI68_14780 [Deltaproteobacteria bacterium]|nr:hypothetical protein [Deltaproteobacteria bacterium]
MGDSAAILSAPTSGGASTALIGEIEAYGIRFGDGKGIIVGRGADQLKHLLGNGYGRCLFHMELDGIRLEQCRIISPRMVFTYQDSRPIVELGFDDDEPDTYRSGTPDITSTADDTDRWPQHD